METMRGPPPKLYSVKKRAGNPGRRPLNAGPAYELKRPNCPPDFPDEARKIFRRLSPVLYDQSLLTVATIPAFHALCLMGGLMYEAQEEIKAHGLLVSGRQGDKPNPAIGIFHTSAAQFRHYLADFGLTPATLQRVPAKKMTRSLEDLVNRP